MIMDKYLIIIISYNDFELINGFISLTRGIIAVFQNFPAVKKGVAKKPSSPFRAERAVSEVILGTY